MRGKKERKKHVVWKENEEKKKKDRKGIKERKREKWLKLETKTNMKDGR